MNEPRLSSRLLVKEVTVEYKLVNAINANLKRELMGLIGFKKPQSRRVTALNNISFYANEGDRIAIMGLNGAGKTTLLQVLAGVLPPAHGSYYLRGRALGLLGGADFGLNAEATGRKNIILMGLALGQSIEEMEFLTPEIIEFSGLNARIDDPVYTYSSGMAARLRFSTITALQPDVLIADESIGTADSVFANRADNRLAEFYKSAGILVMASHNVAMLRNFCTRGLVLNAGSLVADMDFESAVVEYQKIVKATQKTK
jgi:ABC-type polysaccharide/polyol phosphate transport system ATPase subunit